MENNSKKIMKVICYVKKEKLCELEWDDMPNTGMGFTFEKKYYIITEIKDKKIKVKEIINGKIVL